MHSISLPLKARRRPVQQRAKITQAAILEAFVRLLVEKGYAQLTMRDIALVAGVGLGTLYEHFPGKASIAAHCIHQRFKAVGRQMQALIAQHRGVATRPMIALLIDGLLAMHADKPNEWSALIALERQVSGLAAYQEMYEFILRMWQQALQAAADAALFESKSAEVVHAAVYGYLYQTLMLKPEKVGNPEFSVQLKALALGYLQFPDAQAL